MKKKTMIALTLITLLLVAVITVAAQSAPTGSVYVDRQTTEPTMVPSTETTGESTSEEFVDVEDAESGETAEPETLAKTTASAANVSTTTAGGSSTTAKPAANIVYAPPPATAAQTTTTTGYVSPPTAATTTKPNTVLYTKGNYEWLGTTQTTTTARPTTTTTQYVPPATTTTTRPPTTTTTTSAAPTTVTQAGPDYEAMGQVAYQDEAIRALNALRAERGLPPLTVNATLTANSLAQAQRMAAAGQEFHSTVDLPGCESVCRVPTNFPAKLLGETLGKHVPQFLTDSRSGVGIAVVRQGNYLYAVMQGS